MDVRLLPTRARLSASAGASFHAVPWCTGWSSSSACGTSTSWRPWMTGGAKVGPGLRAWLESLGEIEALAALAALVHAHPGWALPAIGATACRLEAQQAGHPLLAPGTRVDNAVTLGPVGTFVLVTGSNMAG